VKRDDSVYDVDANTSIEDIAEVLESPYHYETVPGFLFVRLLDIFLELQKNTKR
jgi:CBS domain containing-hemolysin-like protein